MMKWCVFPRHPGPTTAHHRPPVPLFGGVRCRRCRYRAAQRHRLFDLFAADAASDARCTVPVVGWAQRRIAPIVDRPSLATVTTEKRRSVAYRTNRFALHAANLNTKRRNGFIRPGGSRRNPRRDIMRSAPLSVAPQYRVTSKVVRTNHVSIGQGMNTIASITFRTLNVHVRGAIEKFRGILI